jgi:hypothetical protein
MGSAVVVWLREKAPHPGPPKLRRLLLTAGHVVREGGQGPVLGEILCWPPDWGYVSPNRIPGRTSGESPGAVTASVCPSLEVGYDAGAPATDWVLLEVNDPRFQAAQAVCGVAEPQGVEPLDIVGYPGGALSWPDGARVESIQSRDFTAQRHPQDPGTLRLNGPDATAPGMSGGGIFNRRGELVGIHRAQSKAQLEFGGVAAEHIRLEIAARGWEIVEESPGGAHAAASRQPSPGARGAPSTGDAVPAHVKGQRLETLLRELFTDPQLRQFIEDLPQQGRQMAEELPGAPVPLNQLVHAAARVLEQFGAARTAGFWDALVTARSGRIDDIDEVRPLWQRI